MLLFTIAFQHSLLSTYSAHILLIILNAFTFDEIWLHFSFYIMVMFVCPIDISIDISQAMKAMCNDFSANLIISKVVAHFFFLYCLLNEYVDFIPNFIFNSVFQSKWFFIFFSLFLLWNETVATLLLMVMMMMS